VGRGRSAIGLAARPSPGSCRHRCPSARVPAGDSGGRGIAAARPTGVSARAMPP